MTVLWLSLVFIGGAMVGSFLNVCIYRLPGNRSVLWPRSHCPACGEDLRAGQLIPIVSFLLLRGQCRYCAAVIPWQYPLVELVTGAMFVLAVVKYGFTLAALKLMLLFCLVVTAALIDLKHRIIPDKLNLVVFILAIPMLLEEKSVLVNGLLGLFICGGLLLFVAVVSRGGMGGGDVKLAAVIGFLLGWPQGLIALFFAFLAGSLIGGVMLWRRRVKPKEPVPFGPFLAVGSILAAFYADPIIRWYGTLLLG